MNRLFQAVCLVIVLAGCAVGPDYRRPAVEAPLSWRQEVKEAQDVANTQWWKQFDEPVLNDLIHTALQENRDLKAAFARVEEYEGRLMVARSGLFPQINASGAGSRNRITEEGPTPTSPSMSNPYRSYQYGLGGVWELDIWGRLRRADESARADLLSTEEGRRGVILTLVSSVASGYITLRELDNELQIVRETVESRKRTLEIFQRRFRGGIISELELSQVKTLYAQALARIPAAEDQISRQENALCVLLGRNPGPIPRGKPMNVLALPMIPQGLPSDLLARRPDIRQAEQNLISANANIGVARGLYFPSISLTGALGGSSAHLSDLFTAPARVWNWGGGVNLPIFSGGAIAGQNKIAKAAAEQALQNYQSTIQNAFREVNDSLSGQVRIRQQMDAQKMQLDALRDYNRVAQKRFDNGYTSYIEVLDAERSLFDAELSYSQAQGALFNEVIAVYQAMGGGWVTEADKLTSAREPSGEEKK